MTAVTAAAIGGRSGGVALLEEAVEVFLRPLLVLVECVHELGGEDLLRPGVHLLLARGEALLHLAEGEVADDLGELEDVAGLDLLAVVLETPVPVLRHLGNVVGEDVCNFLNFLLVDNATQTCLASDFAGDHHRQVVVEDLDREVFAFLPHQLARLFGHHQARAVMRVDNLVALLEVADVLHVLFEDSLYGGLV
jgi:hypothetical protein